ncbi:hypothetical protein ECANGB1_1792 [Enterospora canceri]|uniref:Uncharacterized protein n=1 Tax=Enterospora canceri TaxID=1081671 RepID=A0A1Y1S5G8_9MICR|nr:hypothetical protein ECANGB1_1792 [Enterospora canceri]
MTVKKFRHNNDSGVFTESSDDANKMVLIKSTDPIDFYTGDGSSEADSKEVDSLNSRKHAICQFGESTQLHKAHLDSTIYFPPHIKLLVKLYKIILNVYNYSKTRKLNLIYEYHKPSMEQVFGQRITQKHLRQLKFILQDSIVFKEIKYGEIYTFIITIAKEEPVEVAILKLLHKNHNNWLKQNNLEHKGKRFHMDFDLSTVEIGQKELFSRVMDSMPHSEDIVKRTADEKYKMILERNKKQEDERRATFIKNEVGEKTVVERAKLEYGAILKRVEEREKIRKAEFIKYEQMKVNYTDKLDRIFRVEDRRAIRLSELEFRIGDVRARENILGALGDKYTKKTIKDDIYIVKQDKSDK